MRQALLTCAFVALLAGACVGIARAADGDDALAALEPPSAKTLQELKADVSLFAGAARVPRTHATQAMLLQKRLILAFQQDPPRRLAVDTNGQIYWGWQEGQAFVQSVAVYDQAGKLRLVAAVDDLPSLYNRRSDKSVTSFEQYHALLDKQASWGSHPSALVFVRSADDLHAHLPLLRRWLQAAMLGFSVDCSDAKAAGACAFVERVTLPMVAFDLVCANQNAVERCRIPVSDIAALPLSLERFVQ